MHGEKSRQEDYIESDEQIELGAIFRVAVLQDIPDDKGQAVEAGPDPDELASDKWERGQK